MSVITALNHLVSDSSELQSLIHHFHPNRLPQKPTYPCAAFRVIDGHTEYALGGPSGLSNPRVEIKCYGNTVAEAEAVRKAMMKLLSGFKGFVGDTGIEIQGCFHVDMSSDDEIDLESSGETVSSVSIEFEIWLSEG